MRNCHGEGDHPQHSYSQTLKQVESFVKPSSKEGNTLLLKFLPLMSIFILCMVFSNKSSSKGDRFLFQYIIYECISVVLVLLWNKLETWLTSKTIHFDLITFFLVNFVLSVNFFVVDSLIMNSANIHWIFLAISIEYFLKFLLELNFYYQKKLSLTMTSLNITLNFIYYNLDRSRASELLAFLKTFLDMMVNCLVFYYEKSTYSKNNQQLEKPENEKLMSEPKFTKLEKEWRINYSPIDYEEILGFMKTGLIVSAKKKVKYRNEFVNELANSLNDLIDEKNFDLEKEFDEYDNITFMLEEFYKKADSIEYTNPDLNVDVLNFLLKEEERILHLRLESEEDETSQPEKVVGDFTIGLSMEKNLTNTAIPFRTSPFYTDESEEEKIFVDKKNEVPNKRSLFKKESKKENKTKLDKLKLSHIHSFLLKNKTSFKNFVHLFSIPIVTNSNHPGFISLSLKIKCNNLNENEFIYLLRDVTSEKQAEQIKNEMKCKSLFLAKIAHEFKNPIITINSLCSNLSNKLNLLMNSNNSYQSSDCDSEEEAKQTILPKQKSSFINHSSINEQINFIIATGNYLMSLIYDLNYFTRMELNSFGKYNKFESDTDTQSFMRETEFELIPALEFCLKIFRERQKTDDNKKNITILSEYDRRLPDKIFTSELKLKQVLINLLSNSYKFTMVGKILLSAKLVENGNIRFEVIDTGSGIPQEKLQSITNPFTMIDKHQSMNSYGSGLGLFIVKDLLRQLNSNLEITSVNGQGSNFNFELKNIRKSLGTRISSDTIFEMPRINESLKKIYIYNYSNNLQDSTDRLENHRYSNDSEISKKKKPKNHKFESCLNLMKYKETLIYGVEPKKRETLTSLLFRRVSNKNMKSIDSEMAESLYHQESCEYSSPPSTKMRVNNLSRKHFFETKYTPFNPFSNDFTKSWKSPVNSIVRGIEGVRRPLNKIMEGLEELDGKHTVIRIMVCDDQSDLREAIVNLLEKIANEKKLLLEVKESINGLECLNAVYQAFVKEIGFDAVFLDEQMPYMKGSKCSSLMTEMQREGCLNKFRKVSISSFEDPDMMKHLKSMGIDEFIPKPHTKEVLTKFLDSLASSKISSKNVLSEK